MSKKLAYLGPAGTYTEQAAILYDPQATLIPCSTFGVVAKTVESGDADEGVVAIENSLEGPVTYTLDMLIHESPLFIRSELALPIHHLLLGKAAIGLSEIQVVYSHPQALGQSRRYLSKNLPNAKPIASLSTSLAVEEMQKHPAAAAISSRRAAELYGAHVLAENIEDNKTNQTRFVILSKTDHPPTGRDKTSICFAFDEDAPGILYQTLGEISDRGINLNKIESRPTRQVLGRYIFLVDIHGHREDKEVKEALEAIKSRVSMFRMFGSYPREVASDT